MSASSKKNAKLTEKQLAQKKEERSVRLYTIGFVVVLTVLLVVAIVSGVNQKIVSSGSRERKTIAMTVNGHQISNAELNYYYIDGINSFYSQSGSYAAMYGLDVTKPLDEQEISSDGTTWADNFLESAKSSASSVYALVDEANAQGYALSADEEAQVTSISDNLAMYGNLYGYSNAEDYLKAMYGNGASMKSYQEYLRNNILADSYQQHYEASLTYTPDQLRAFEQDREQQYCSFNYNQYFVSTNSFLTGGTDDGNGSTTYSDEERAAAAEEAKKVAKSIVSGNIQSPADFDAAIAAAVEGASSTAYTNQQFTAVSSKISDWLSDASRKEGDMTYVESSYTSTDAEGKEITNISGYYVVYFTSASDNRFPLINVRHILVGFEGGTTDENGQTVYSDDEKAAAKAKAEEIYAQWMGAEATEESFAALATEKTDDTGSAENGGLYENVYPGQMVSAFNDWCYDASRKEGDTGIVETEYGYHIMYFVGNADTTYRDYLITNDIREDDFNVWYSGLVDSANVTDGVTTYIQKDIVLSRGN